VKNKKLFAILTLVCFMFTLMPVAAFAGVDDQVLLNGKDSLKVKDNVAVVATVESTTGNFYFFAVAEGAADDDSVVAGDVEYISAVAEEAADLSDLTAGKYDVYAVKASAALTADLAKVAGSTAKVNLMLEDAGLLDGFAPLTVVATDDVYTLTLVDGVAATGDDADNGYEYVITGVASNNGWKAPEYVIKVVDDAAKNVKNAEVKYTTNSGYIKVVEVEEATDRLGEVAFKLAATKAGTYKVTAAYEDAKIDIKVVVGASEVAGVKVVAAPQTPNALDNAVSQYTGIAFELTDANGTVLKAGTDLSNIEVELISAPADSDLVDEEFTLRWDANENEAWTLRSINNLTFDEEGTYEFKVTLENGASATAKMTVKEFDEPVRMILTLKENNIVAGGGEVAVKRIVMMDKNYVAKPVYAGGYDMNYTDFEVVANGKAVAGVNNMTIATKADSVLDVEKQVGTTITVMAINEEFDLTATATLEVVNAAEAIEFATTDAKLAENNELAINAVDANGNVVTGIFADAEVNVYVLDAPVNAAYSVDGEIDADDNAVVNFTASANGEYKVQVVVKSGSYYYSTVGTIVVGGAVSNFNDVVVMSIGAANIVVNSEVKAIPAAPMIQDARTFVPFRALAEAFGAEVAWDEATQSVTAELNGVKVVMTIGSADYTVNGVAAKADVAPFINGASTMVPVRFVAEAFGINVTPIAAEDGSVADVLFAK
jgi:hypothetical protein